MYFTPGDPEAYLSLLHAYGRRYGLAVFAYCLMPNHVHLVVVPSGKDSLPRTLQAVNGQYAQRINRMRAISGHLWQGRYHCSALDAAYFLNATRYVERNPVAAGMVARAQDYRWSSAAAHCGRRSDPLLEPAGKSSVLSGIEDWSSWLAKSVPDDCRKLLQRNARLGLPCGSDSFIEELEEIAGCELKFHPHGGRQKKAGGK